jgi:distribution and morphology protein 31
MYTTAGPEPKRGWFARLKLLLTRRRGWTRDDVWALGSWLFVGQGLFILAGTTTFASVVLLLANSLQFQDWLARRLTKYLAKHTGLEFAFGETIVPNWRNGRISFRDVSIKSLPDKDDYARYNLRVDSAEVTLSMKRYLEGKGLVVSCEMSGIRGIVDRTNVRPHLYEGWRYQGQTGDFDMQQVSLRDLLVTIHNPDGHRSYEMSVISANLPRLRKKYILYDFLAAESVVGVLDGSLFSMHIPQVSFGANERKRCVSMRHLKMNSLNVDFFTNGATTGPISWLTKGSVDVNVFIQLPANYRHPSDSESITDKLGTLTEGILVQIFRESSVQIPSEDYTPWAFDELSQIRDGFRNVHKSLFGPFFDRLRSRMQEDFLNVDDRALEAPEKAALHFIHPKPDIVTFKVDFRFHNLRAHLPLWTSERGLVGTTLMRPLVAYINEQRPFIPISCHFDISMEQLEGSWTLYESGIVGALSKGATDSFEMLVSDRHKKIKRLKRVSLWSLYAIFRNIRVWMTDAGYFPHLRILHHEQ